MSLQEITNNFYNAYLNNMSGKIYTILRSYALRADDATELITHYRDLFSVIKPIFCGSDGPVKWIIENDGDILPNTDFYSINDLPGSVIESGKLLIKIENKEFKEKNIIGWYRTNKDDDLTEELKLRYLVFIFYLISTFKSTDLFEIYSDNGNELDDNAILTKFVEYSVTYLDDNKYKLGSLNKDKQTENTTYIGELNNEIKPFLTAFLKYFKYRYNDNNDFTIILKRYILLKLNNLSNDNERESIMYEFMNNYLNTEINIPISIINFTTDIINYCDSLFPIYHLSNIEYLKKKYKKNSFDGKMIDKFNLILQNVGIIEEQKIDIYNKIHKFIIVKGNITDTKKCMTFFTDNKDDGFFKTIFSYDNDEDEDDRIKVQTLFDNISSSKNQYNYQIILLSIMNKLIELSVTLLEDNVETNSLIAKSGNPFTITNMNLCFQKDLFELDPRQVITVNRFTKFKDPRDKCCFLFHGVGTGKTITSSSIAFSNLTEKNRYYIEDEVPEEEADEADEAEEAEEADEEAEEADEEAEEADEDEDEDRSFEPRRTSRIFIKPNRLKFGGTTPVVLDIYQKRFNKTDESSFIKSKQIINITELVGNRPLNMQALLRTDNTDKKFIIFLEGPYSKKNYEDGTTRFGTFEIEPLKKNLFNALTFKESFKMKIEDKDFIKLLKENNWKFNPNAFIKYETISALKKAPFNPPTVASAVASAVASVPASAVASAVASVPASAVASAVASVPLPASVRSGDTVPLKILIIAPQGIFSASFAEDCNNIGCYTYDNFVQTIEEGLFIESFSGIIKNGDNFYKLQFFGYDYNALFHPNGYKIINDLIDSEKIDIFICDESHRLITNSLLPKDLYEKYDINCNDYENPDIVIPNETDTLGNIKYKGNCITDNRFLQLIKKIKKQTILLTGTPYQTSDNDMIDITWFLNNPSINKSNFKVFSDDVLKYGGNALFKPLDEPDAWNKTKELDIVGESIIYNLFKQINDAFKSNNSEDLQDNIEDGAKYFLKLNIAEDTLKSIQATATKFTGVFGSIFSVPFERITGLTDRGFDSYNNTLKSAVDILRGRDTTGLYELSELTDRGFDSYDNTVRRAVDSYDNTVKSTADFVRGIDTTGLSRLPGLPGLPIVGDFNKHIDNIDKNIKRIADALSPEPEVIAPAPVLPAPVLPAVAAANGGLVTGGNKPINNKFKKYGGMGISDNETDISTINEDIFKKLLIVDYGINLLVDDNNLSKIAQKTKLNIEGTTTLLKYGISTYYKHIFKTIISTTNDGTDRSTYNDSLFFKLNKYTDIIKSLNSSDKMIVGGADAANITNQLKTIGFVNQYLFTGINDCIKIILSGQGNGNNKGIDMNALIAGTMNTIYNSILSSPGVSIALARKLVEIASGVVINITEFLVKVNTPNIIKHIKPFISIYNYDYGQKAIDKEVFDEELKKPETIITSKVNIKGNTFSFAKKYVDQILIPFTKNQLTLIQQFISFYDKNEDFFINMSNLGCFDESSLEVDTEKKSSILAGLDEEYGRKFTEIEGQEQSKQNEIVEKQRDVYFFSYEKEYDEKNLRAKIDKFKEKVPDFYKFNFEKEDYDGNTENQTYENMKKDIIDYLKEYKQYNTKKNPCLQIDVKSLDTEKFKKENLIKTECKLDACPINIENNFDLNIQEFEYDFDKNNIFDNLLKTTINNMKILNEKDKIKIFNIESGDNTMTRFDYTLDLLKIINCGLIYSPHKNYYLQPHYYMLNNYPNIEYRCYLPLVYPPTRNIMYKFVDYLNKNEIKYIWLHDKMASTILDKNYKHGAKFTVPMNILKEGMNKEDFEQNFKTHPICVIISPSHTEGFSFTFSPALISLSLCRTAGDAEQLYGRVLRKYNEPAISGNYCKQIYQYFGGTRIDSHDLSKYVNKYGTEYTTFKSIYKDVINRKKSADPTENFLDSLVLRDLSIWFTTFKQTLSKNFEQTTDLLNSAERNISRYGTFTEKGISKKKKMDDELKESFVSEDYQLTILNNINKLSKEFFDNLTSIENKTIDNATKTIVPFDIQLINSLIIGKTDKKYCKNPIMCVEKSILENNVDYTKQFDYNAGIYEVKFERIEKCYIRLSNSQTFNSLLLGDFIQLNKFFKSTPKNGKIEDFDDKNFKTILKLVYKYPKILNYISINTRFTLINLWNKKYEEIIQRFWEARPDEKNEFELFEFQEFLNKFNEIVYYSLLTKNVLYNDSNFGISPLGDYMYKLLPEPVYKQLGETKYFVEVVTINKLLLSIPLFYRFHNNFWAQGAVYGTLISTLLGKSDKVDGEGVKLKTKLEGFLTKEFIKTKMFPELIGTQIDIIQQIIFFVCDLIDEMNKDDTPLTQQEQEEVNKSISKIKIWINSVIPEHVNYNGIPLKNILNTLLQDVTYKYLASKLLTKKNIQITMLINEIRKYSSKMYRQLETVQNIKNMNMPTLIKTLYDSYLTLTDNEAKQLLSKLIDSFNDINKAYNSTMQSAKVNFNLTNYHVNPFLPNFIFRLNDKFIENYNKNKQYSLDTLKLTSKEEKQIKIDEAKQSVNNDKDIKILNKEIKDIESYSDNLEYREQYRGKSNKTLAELIKSRDNLYNEKLTEALKGIDVSKQEAEFNSRKEDTIKKYDESLKTDFETISLLINVTEFPKVNPDIDNNFDNYKQYRYEMGYVDSNSDEIENDTNIYDVINNNNDNMNGLFNNLSNKELLLNTKIPFITNIDLLNLDKKYEGKNDNIFVKTKYLIYFLYLLHKEIYQNENKKTLKYFYDRYIFKYYFDIENSQLSLENKKSFTKNVIEPVINIMNPIFKRLGEEINKSEIFGGKKYTKKYINKKTINKYITINKNKSKKRKNKNRLTKKY